MTTKLFRRDHIASREASGLKGLALKGGGHRAHGVDYRAGYIAFYGVQFFNVMYRLGWPWIWPACTT